MKIVRTPDERFEGLPGYPFAPHYAEIADGEGGTLRVHYLDEGPADAPPVLLLHGEPSWSYLYRHMIPVISGAGLRVIAPDLVGFGRSDKPTERSDHTYAAHVSWMSRLVFDELGLTDITLFGQDWGGLIGLRLVAARPERFANVVIGNTGLPTGHGSPSEAFVAWRDFAANAAEFPIGQIVNWGSASDLPAEVIAAYDAPFPDDTFTAGARAMPALVPTSLEDPASADNIAAWQVLEQFNRPFVLAFSDGDPITRGGDAPFRDRVPGCVGRRHAVMAGGGHFLQEDCGPELAEVIIETVRGQR